MPKTLVSPEWTVEERAAVMLLIDDAIWWTELDLEDAQKTILWRAPYIIGLDKRICDLRQQRHFVDVQPSYFLEVNRRNFSEFVE